MVQINPKDEYLAMQPRFSKQFTRLVYIGRTEKFLSHTGVYELKALDWPSRESHTIIQV